MNHDDKQNKQSVDGSAIQFDRSIDRLENGKKNKTKHNRLWMKDNKNFILVSRKAHCLSITQQSRVERA